MVEQKISNLLAGVRFAYPAQKRESKRIPFGILFRFCEPEQYFFSRKNGEAGSRPRRAAASRES